ncbi:uncharacterized protein LOC132760466 [Ruditapes philippinarum]|uniref:uncharacterized protein LOC132760466 n=1 Tax=Ruditapes philippinarum TaxID=129788 RepID=UPI00295AEFEF|nr:uncharacterized protein LOC132760466 [Ruditapes philippinarum]
METRSEICQEVDELHHGNRLEASKTIDMKTVITVAGDSNLRIWDRTKSKQPTNESADNNLSQKIGRIYRLWSLEPTRYMFVEGTATSESSDVLFGVYDCITDKFIKIRRMNVITYSSNVHQIDATRVLVKLNRKLFVINLNTMDIETKLQGFTCKDSSYFKYTPRNQLICHTKADKNLKIYDLSTGKVVCVLKAGQTMNLESFVVNSTGKVACASSDKGPLILYDLVDQEVMYTIPSKPDYHERVGLYKWINAEGTRLIFSTRDNLPYMTEGVRVDHLVVWDIQNKKELFRMYDSVYQQKYEALKNMDDTSVAELRQLDDRRMITLNRDKILRVYDLDTGKLLHRLEGGHSTSLKLHEKSPYILTCEEDCIRLWDKTTYKQVATFSLDKTIENLLWSGCGRFFYTTSSNPAKVLRWKIHYGHKEVSDISFDEDSQSIFSSKAEFEPLEIEIPEDVKFPTEEGDPDDDVEVPSDDEDDDDGDD